MTIIPRQKPKEEGKKPVVDPIIAETHRKATELQELTSQVDEKNQQVIVSRAEHDRILREKENAEKQLAEYEAKSNKVADKSNLVNKRTDLLGNEIVRREEKVNALSDRLAQKEREIKEAEDRINELGKKVKEAEGELVSVLTKIDTSKKELKTIESQKNDSEVRVKNLLIQEDKIIGNIETAIENFRVFEARIKNFSDETGYIIKYSPVEMPKK